MVIRKSSKPIFHIRNRFNIKPQRLCLINSLFFDPKRYDLARVGRYKYNKKLAIARRLSGQLADAIGRWKRARNRRRGQQG